jgi:lipopolysaccharide/colanic/teichoic acid biosynthesis glycosyltransferase
MARIIDVIVSSALLIVLAPLLAITALAVKLTSRGTVFYRAERVGLGGARFRMLKFRTMVSGADRTGPGITTRDDPRITSVGRFLRATKLDELPQLINVLLGEMTLIGPRAESPQFVEHYGPEQRRLLEVLPGVTGPGQLHYTTDQQDRIVDLDQAEEVYVRDLMTEKLKMDLEYLEKRTFWTDLGILLQTVGVVAAGLGRALFRLGRTREGSAQALPGGPGPVKRKG